MANKVMRWLTLGLIIPIIFVACASEKDKYFDRYAKFATHVLQNSETFTSMDWEAAVVQYEESVPFFRDDTRRTAAYR